MSRDHISFILSLYLFLLICNHIPFISLGCPRRKICEFSLSWETAPENLRPPQPKAFMRLPKDKRAMYSRWVATEKVIENISQERKRSLRKDEDDIASLMAYAQDGATGRAMYSLPCENCDDTVLYYQEYLPQVNSSRTGENSGKTGVPIPVTRFDTVSWLFTTF